MRAPDTHKLSRELLVRVDDWFDTRVHKLLVKTGYEFTSRRTLLSEKVFSIIKLR